jgi:hypothetical protein
MNEREERRGEETGEIGSVGIFMSTVWLDDGMGRRLSRVSLETAFYRLLVFIRSVTSSLYVVTSFRASLYVSPCLRLLKIFSAKLHREPRGIEDEKATERSWFVRYLLYCCLDMECCSIFGVNRVRV